MSLPAIKNNILYVFSSRSKALSILRVKRKAFTKVRLIPVKVESRERDWSVFADELNTLRIQRVFLLGFMQIVPKTFLNVYKGEVFNLHPSLLPDFKGADAFNRSFESRKSVGASIHYVNEFLDAGEIALQKELNCCFKSDLVMYNDKNMANKVHSYVEQELVRCFLIRNL